MLLDKAKCYKEVIDMITDSSVFKRTHNNILKNCFHIVNIRPSRINGNNLLYLELTFYQSLCLPSLNLYYGEDLPTVNYLLSKSLRPAHHFTNSPFLN